jgi:hypothetical protein
VQEGGSGLFVVFRGGTLTPGADLAGPVDSEGPAVSPKAFFSANQWTCTLHLKSMVGSLAIMVVGTFRLLSGSQATKEIIITAFLASCNPSLYH